MSTARPGDIVSVIYDGFLDNNEIFETSDDTGPLQFTIGGNQVMPDFEKNIIGMNEGESSEFTLPPEAAHGQHNPDLVHTIQRQGLKGEADFQIGTLLSLDVDRDGETHKVPAMVSDVQEKTIQVDFNHPLAGKALRYKVTLQKITHG